jgi:ribosome-binding factor A
MKRSSRFESILRALCGEPGPEDGCPPAPRSRSSQLQRPDRKTWQLCAQALRALEYALGEVCPQFLRHVAYIQSVVPAPDASQLLVTVAVRESLAPPEQQQLLTALMERQGRLRAAVATAITRRKAPALTFRVITETDPSPEDHRHD